VHGSIPRLESPPALSVRTRLLSAACLSVLVASVMPARADTFSTFNISGTLGDGGTVSGNVTLDTTTNLFSGSDFTAFTSERRFTFTQPPDAQNPVGSIGYFANFIAITGAP
jgi:hypothetical protein